MNAKENASWIIRFDHPWREVSQPPLYELCYQGCHHEGFEGELGDDHPVGSCWYERLFQYYKAHDVLSGFHSCGNLVAVLGTFIDLGVDVLNPVHVTANDLDQVRSATQGRMVLQGGVTSATIMEGPPERIVGEVHQRILQLGRDGGYFCGPDRFMPYPQDHLDALDQAVAQHGRYPLE